MKTKHNYTSLSELEKKAKEENVKSKHIFESRLNPSVKAITADENGVTFHVKDASEPATLEMVQYYYHLGNIYKDRICTKANVAMACAAISTIVSTLSIIISLL